MVLVIDFININGIMQAASNYIGKCHNLLISKIVMIYNAKPKIRINNGTILLLKIHLQE